MQKPVFQDDDGMVDCVIVDGSDDADWTHTQEKFSTVIPTEANEEITVCYTTEREGSGNATDAASEKTSVCETDNKENSICYMDNMSVTPKE